MDGGKLIGTGSSSCVFSPDIPCKGEKYKKNDKRVSKFIYDKGAIDMLNTEKKMNMIIKKIKNYSDWCLVFDKYCKAPSLEKVKEYEDEIDECLERDSISYEEYDNIDKISYLTSGTSGGITLEDYFIENYSKLNNSNLEKKFMDLMNMIEPLFNGLKIMHDNKIIHNDIKGINIVMHDNKFKFIDFGLAGLFNNQSHFKKRSINEFNTGRIYIYYPIDYIYYYASNSSLNKELQNIKDGEVRRHFDDLYDYYYSLFKKDFYEICEKNIDDIKNKRINEKNMLQKIDVYSIGSLIPLLFMFESNIEFPHNKNDKINAFYSLFKDMTDPDLNDRISATEAYNRFKMLLNGQKNLKSKRRRNNNTNITKKSKRKGVRRVTKRR